MYLFSLNILRYLETAAASSANRSTPINHITGGGIKYSLQEGLCVYAESLTDNLFRVFIGE